MGMDVYGKNPTSEKGGYFRNNLWYWRPLWTYCLHQHGDLCGKVEGALYNDGDGLDADDARTLGERLLADVADGTVAAFKTTYDAALASLPLEDCAYCNKTGIRTDEVGVSMGWVDIELPEADAIILGRTHGSCNCCNGYGQRPSFFTLYPFEVENVQEFAEFLMDCGGFEIW